MAELRVSDIPKLVLTEVEALEKEHDVEDYKIALVNVANAIADVGDKARVFEEALNILKGHLRDQADFMPISGIFFLGLDGPKNWNEWEIARVSKMWRSADPSTREAMKNSGQILTVKEIDDEGNEIDRIVSKLSSWRYDDDAERLVYEVESYWESESDPVVFIDKREKIGKMDNKWRVNRPLMPRWDATMKAVIGIDTGKGVEQYPAKITLRGQAADPSNKDNLLGLYAGRAFRFFKQAKAKAPKKSKDGRMYYIDGKTITVAGCSEPSITDIEKTLETIGKVDKVTTADLQAWCQRYADKMSEEKDYDRCIYITAKLAKVQKFPSGDVQLQIVDKYTPSQYYISAELPKGTTLESFSVVPGSMVQIIGRAYLKRNVYNWSTGQKEEKHWPHIVVQGIKTYIDVKSEAVANILATLGMGGESLTDDGEEE